MVSNSVTFASPLQPSRPAPDSPSPGHSQRNHHNYTPFSLRRKTMSVTQTYYLAHKARAKLAREASRADHDLRLLVGHANLLDGLMLELADAEREQESWFNNSVRGAVEHEDEEEAERVQYRDTIIEIHEGDDAWDSSDDSSDSDSESYDDEEDDVEMADTVSMRRVHVSASRIQDEEEDSDDYDDDDDDDYSQLELVRTSSHSSPPELDDDEDTSEDESMPPSPPTAMLTFSDKEAREEGDDEEDALQQQQQQSEGSPFYEADNFFVPARNPARLVPTIPIC